MFAILALAAVIWNGFVGMTWQAPTNLEIAGMVAALASISFYAAVRKEPKLSEASLFLLFYLLYPLFGIRLSYLAVALDFPLVDATISHLDAMLGFDWNAWARIEADHPDLLPLQAVFYESHLLQVILLGILFSFVRPARRNYEMLFLLLLCLIVSLILLALFPTLGPASLTHTVMPHELIFGLLRGGHFSNLPYDGIISFPSYHTIMAIVFVYCCRGIRFVFLPVLIWNTLMLITVPYGGDHYLTDMVAGAVIAGCSIALSRLIYAVPASRTLEAVTDRLPPLPAPEVL